MDIDIIKNTEELMKKALDSLDKKFQTVRAGRANPASLDGVMVSYYGSMMPLKQLATISVPEARPRESPVLFLSECSSLLP